MKLKGIIDTDTINYKKISMVLEFPICKNFKCDRECGMQVCQNSKLATAQDITVDVSDIIKQYIDNPLTEAIVCQGLEPFDTWYNLFFFITEFRQYCNDDIVIYTGYTEEEISSKVKALQAKHLGFKNIIIKFGRFIPDQQSHYDEVLGVTLASPNQYAKKIC